MSIEAIAHTAENFVLEAEICPEARDDIFSVLRANRTDMPAFLLALALEAGVPAALALRRAVAIYLNIGALQVADDIADGDCHYLADPAAAGTAAQFMLQNLFYSALFASGLSPEVLRCVARDLVTGAAPQSFEIRVSEWDLVRARAVAEGFGGAHHRAYLRILWHGSRFEDRAAEAGFGLGIGISVASDVRSGDPRFGTLPTREKSALLDFALGSLSPARSVELPSMQRALVPIENALVSALLRCDERDAPTGSDAR